MANANDSGAGRIPMGAWWRVYALCAAVAVAVLLLLWWFTHAYNIPMGRT